MVNIEKNKYSNPKGVNYYNYWKDKFVGYNFEIIMIRLMAVQDSEKI